MKSNTTSPGDSNKSSDHKTQKLCITKGCKNSTVSHPDWDNEYCSSICCYNHCKNIFKSWLAANRAESKTKTNTISSNQVPSSSNQQI